MGLTFVQKVLARYAGKPAVEVGEIVNVTPDHVLSHDNSAAIAKTFAKIGKPRVKDPAQPVIVLDHCAPAADSKYATNHKEIRQFVTAQGLKNFFDIASGVCHQVFMEQGFAAPGRLLLGSDSHTTTYGAAGAFAAGIGRSEAAAIWATGTMWLMVPETLRLVLKGDLPADCSAKDVVLFILGRIGADGALYKSVEFTGPVIEAMDVDDRMVLTNMAAEMGAKNGYVLPDEKTRAWLRGRVRGEYQEIFSDPDAGYSEVLEWDLSDLRPQVACPHFVDNVKPASDMRGTKVDQVVVGTCTNGRLRDLHEAAAVLKGRKVASGTRLLVFPASMPIFKQAMADGTLAALLEAGAVLMNPNCGPCLGAHEGALAPGEVCVSTSNRNFKGRMGCNESAIYLASPRTAAITALKGVLDDTL
jgi:3-isopropylmalate/(R)-2-methylmalate dehydratase large subunit